LGWLFVALVLVYHWVQSKQGVLSWIQVGLVAGLIAALAHGQMDAFQALPPLAAWNWVALALLLALEKAQTKTATESGSGL
jgi:hypothetical protein